jgi:hypothetical protein
MRWFAKPVSLSQGSTGSNPVLSALACCPWF